MSKSKALSPEDWQPFLDSNEVLKWTGDSQFPSFYFVAAAIILFCSAAFYLYFPLSYQSVIDACGQTFDRNCRRIYYLGWPVGLFMGSALLYCLYELVAQTGGLIRIHYAITNKRVLSLTKGRFGRANQRLVTADIGNVVAKFGEKSIELRSSSRLVLLMSGLTEFDIMRARFAIEPARTEEQ